jgi:membrane-bound lytic murein transglycosylase B
VERSTDDAGQRSAQAPAGPPDPRSTRPRRLAAADTGPSGRRLLLGAAVGLAGLSAVLAVGTGRSASTTTDLQDVAAAESAAPTSPGWLSAGAPAGAVTLPAAPTTAATPAPADDATVTGLAANGIPNVALNAYRVAAARMGTALGSCHIDWSLLAGIGRVESNHGRFGGAVLNADGTSTPPIVGPALDGVAFAFITDTDDGRWDGDPIHDRAVGPMQFIPSTWRSYSVDADGSGVADPFDIDDEALAAAHYLCVAGGDLATEAGQRRAVLAYNHSDSYVAQVLALARSYAAGIPVADLPLLGDTSSPVPGPTGDFRAPAAPGPAIGAADRTSGPAGQETVLPAGAAAPPAGGGAPAPAPAEGGDGGSTSDDSGSGGGAAAPTPAPTPAPPAAERPPGAAPAKPEQALPDRPLPTPVQPPALPVPQPPVPQLPPLPAPPLPPLPVPALPVPALPVPALPVPLSGLP